MNNWDKRPTIEVATSNVVLPYLTEIVVDKILDGSIGKEPKIHEVEGDFYYITEADKQIDDYTIQNALSCLKDHMDNTPIGEWATVVGDLLVDKEDNLWVTEWSGTYHGPKIDIQVTYYEA